MSTIKQFKYGQKFLLISIVVAVFGYFIFINDKVSQKTGEPVSENKDSGQNSVNLFDMTKWDKYEGDGYSFRYFQDLKVAETLAEEGKVITVEEGELGFQVYISAFDETGPITPERIWQDVPDVEINEPKNADLDGTPTLVFYSNDENFGETFEAWVVRDSKLYQVLGPKAAEQLIVKVLETWSWK